MCRAALYRHGGANVASIWRWLGSSHRIGAMDAEKLYIGLKSYH